MDFKDKIRTIGAPRRTGQAERVMVRNEETGGVAGYHVKEWDGRQAAVVTPETVKVKIGVNQ